jgi:hypothetical protein
MIIVRSSARLMLFSARYTRTWTPEMKGIIILHRFVNKRKSESTETCSGDSAVDSQFQIFQTIV